MPKTFPFLTAVAFTAGAALALAQEAPPAEKAPAVAPAVVEKKPATPKPIDTSFVERPGPKPTPKPGATLSTPAPAAEVAATPTPKPKKLSFFQRLFGKRSRQPVATPTPAPTSTPTPTPRKFIRTPSATPTPDSASVPKPAKPTPAKTSTPAPVIKPEKPLATPKPIGAALATPAPAKKGVPAKPAVTETQKPVIEPPADADPEVKEKFRYEQAKAKATEDPQVKSLKAKADDAATDEESRKALRAYNKALFEKIRKIDSSVSSRADQLEAAILKRLSE